MDTPDLQPAEEAPAPRAKLWRWRFPAMTFGCAATLLAVGVQCGCAAVLQIALFGASAALEEKGLVSLATHPLALGAINTVAVAVVLVGGVLLLRRPVQEVLTFRRFSPWLLPPLVLSMAGASIVLSEADNLLRSVLPMPAWIVALVEQSLLGGHSLLASWILLVVIAPITEELLFRGLILNTLLRRYSPLVAILFSSLLFALMHMNPWQLAVAMVIGVLLGWLYVRTRSLWPCILGHAIMNSGPNLVGLLPWEIPGYTTALEGQVTHQPWWFDLLGVALLAIGVGLMWGILRGSRPTPAPETAPRPPVGSGDASTDTAPPRPGEAPGTPAEDG